MALYDAEPKEGEIMHIAKVGLDAPRLGLDLLDEIAVEAELRGEVPDAPVVDLCVALCEVHAKEAVGVGEADVQAELRLEECLLDGVPVAVADHGDRVEDEPTKGPLEAHHVVVLDSMDGDERQSVEGLTHGF